MSKSSYCVTPGSAYPWSSVKRYISDNQGLVRRMYGDENYSSVLFNEIDGFRLRFEMLRNSYDGYHSRTVYGRSAKAAKPRRRQPRPQKLDQLGNEPSTPFLGEAETIFRVVTETSIKVGESYTQPMSPPTETSVSYEPASEFEHPTGTPTTTTVDTTTATTPTTAEDTTAPVTDDIPPTTEAYTTTTESPPTTTPYESTTSKGPLAMHRIGGMEYAVEYDPEPEPKRKSGSPSHQNSVEEKVRDKEDEPRDKEDETRNKEDYLGDMMKTDSKFENRGPSIEEDLVVEESVEDSRQENAAVEKIEEEKVEEEKVEEAKEESEEIPRRGINACPVKNEVIAPYWANNTRGETLALLNVHPFEQYVHFEKCAFENHQMLCREGCRCEQQYRLHRLLAFDPKNECRGIFSDWFRFPSCCVCICYDLTPDIPRMRSRTGRIEF